MATIKMLEKLLYPLIALLVRRTGRDPAEIASILTRPIESDTDLVDLSRDLDRLRQEARHV